MNVNKNQNNQGVSPLVMGAVGAAVGAVAVAMSDEKNRQKVMNTLNSAGEEANKMKSQATDKLDELKSQASDLQEDLQGKAEKAAEEAKKKVTK